MLDQKSLTELRTIAQGLGIKDIFNKAPNVLIQEIHKKNNELIPQPKIEIPVQYKVLPTGMICDKDVFMDLLEPYIKRGLKVTLVDEIWHFSYGIKNDSGTLRMPYKIVLKKAREILS